MVSSKKLFYHYKWDYAAGCNHAAGYSMNHSFTSTASAMNNVVRKVNTAA